ncbi:MAG: alkaline phosphatase family protein [bacterium]|nr:alkaline phosphatase family protein [bacterium]
MNKNKRWYPTPKLLGILLFVYETANAVPCTAYIGPGAGFAFAGSAFVFLVAFIAALLLILLWPVRAVWKLICGKKISKNAQARRVVVLGLDGIDPRLVEQYSKQGALPNLKQLGEHGVFRRLATTYPSISPVAWSSFQTGVNPGAHNIFDFLTLDRRFHVPDLSSSHIGTPKRFIKIGKWQFPLGKPEIRLLRKSQPFWKVLSDAGIFSNILRVPISFPPEKCYGTILSAMCTPDIRGSQGTFAAYSTREPEHADTIGGVRILVERTGNKIASYIEGPPNPLLAEKTPMKVPFTLIISPNEDFVELSIQKQKYTLELNKHSPWVRVVFTVGFGIKISGICRFCVRQVSPEFRLYVTPINIDPESPVLPISEPRYYAGYLSKLNGLYGTLGFMEDTWGLNEHVLNDETFLEQTYLIHEEREKMFFNALDKTPEGLCVCVFDASDRIQHMFWRYIDPQHPAPKDDAKRFECVIPQMYQRMDALVGKTLKKLGKNDVIMVISDHGFRSFRRGIHINTWLYNHGLLALKNGITGADYFQDVDWSKTYAYAVGLGGIFLNRKSRETQGIVDDAEAASVKAKIIEKLAGLKDPETGETAILNVYDSNDIYRGLYTSAAPDLIVGYNDGYRISWESVTGKLSERIFEDNLKAWSGDHTLDPKIAPGIFYCNRKTNAVEPHIIDIAPTVLSLFNVKIPRYMEGKALL